MEFQWIQQKLNFFLLLTLLIKTDFIKMIPTKLMKSFFLTQFDFFFFLRIRVYWITWLELTLYWISHYETIILITFYLFF